MSLFNRFIITIDHYWSHSSLFITIHHYSSLLITIHRYSSLFIIFIITMNHVSSLQLHRPWHALPAELLRWPCWRGAPGRSPSGAPRGPTNSWRWPGFQRPFGENRCQSDIPYLPPVVKGVNEPPLISINQWEKDIYAMLASGRK